MPKNNEDANLWNNSKQIGTPPERNTGIKSISISQKIGMNVYSIRKQKDISIEQLSKKLEIRPYRLRQLEKFGFTIKAYRQPVDVEDIYKIAEALEIDPLYIFTYPDEYDKDKPEEILSAEGVESAEVFKNHVVCELTPKRNKNGDLVIKFKVYGRAMKIILPGV